MKTKFFETDLKFQSSADIRKLIWYLETDLWYF